MSPAGAAGARPRERSLLRYLLVPRPKDLVKAIVLPLGFAVGAVVTTDLPEDELARALLVWVALEFLLYQARYQWNDARGFAADQAHPDRVARGRLPGPLDRARPHIAASLGVALLRLVLAAAVALTVPQVAGVLAAAAAGVFGAALVYERLRSAATGRAAFPVPLRPPLVALWVAVGAGYAVRGMTGLALAVDLRGRPGLAVAAAVTMWALGVVFCTCRWALEAMCFARVRDGRLVWDVRAGQAREHTLGLVRWLPAAVPAGTEPCAWRALRGRTALNAPWNVAVLVAAAAAALTGRLLTGSSGVTGGLLAPVAGAAAALGVLLAVRHRLAATAAGAAVLVLVLAAAGTARPVLAAVPWLVVLAAYGCFTRQCADEIGHPLRRLAPLSRT
jgi:hypothetical protein